jgi:arylsulfatase
MKKERRRSLITIPGLALLLLLTGMWVSYAQTDRPPNIVIIFTDDQGYADLGVYGAKTFTTPNIDRMAKEGLRFTSFYVSQAVCSASRSSLLTGCYAERVSIRGALMPWATVGLNPEEETIADLLKERGYATGIFGKWHLGHHREFLPPRQGFDEYFGLPYSNDMWPVDYAGVPITEGKKIYYPVLPLIEGSQKAGEVRTLDDQDRLTTLYTERAVRFIQKHKERPFFLYVPHSMPHVPLGVSRKFRGKSEQGFYGDVIMEIDWSVGQILKALKENGLEETTLVIFASDNGPWLNFGNHGGSAVPLREGKGTMWEGGPRVPCIMRWPGRIAEGRVTDAIAASIDLLPTIAAITGAPLPSRPIDGVNILPLLEGEDVSGPRDRFLYYYVGELRAVREGKWKLHFPHKHISYKGVEPGNDGLPGRYGRGETGFELYDLENDIGETADLAKKHPDVVGRLKALASDARQILGDELTGVKGSEVRPPGRLHGPHTGMVRNMATGKSLALENPPDPKFPGGGEESLIDGNRGTMDHADGVWQGFKEASLVARIDLGEPIHLERITAGFLENQSARVFLPSVVEIALSGDGEDFEVIEKLETGSAAFSQSPHIKDFSVDVDSSAPVRYVRLTGVNLGTAPDWHPKAGQKIWIFADEIIVE